MQNIQSTIKLNIYDPVLQDLIWFIEFFTTTCLHTHSWLNWVDEDNDEVDLKEKPEDTKIHQQYYIKIRREAPGVWPKDLIKSDIWLLWRLIFDQTCETISLW